MSDLNKIHSKLTKIDKILLDHILDKNKDKSESPFTDKDLKYSFENIVEQVIDLYINSNEDQRDIIRKSIKDYRGFRHFFGVTTKSLREEGNEDLFRRALLLISIQNGGIDVRDAKLYILEVIKIAKEKNIDLSHSLKEAANLSSEEPLFFFPSMKEILLNHIPKFSSPKNS